MNLKPVNLFLLAFLALQIWLLIQDRFALSSFQSEIACEIRAFRILAMTIRYSKQG